jgi:hypothetical protein
MVSVFILVGILESLFSNNLIYYELIMHFSVGDEAHLKPPGEADSFYF